MKIVDNIRPDRQTVLFSATFPRQMEALARKILTKPIEVQVGGRSVVCSDVTQHAVSQILEEVGILDIVKINLCICHHLYSSVEEHHISNIPLKGFPFIKVVWYFRYD